MANYFDQFDAQQGSPPTGGNFFDQFDTPKQPSFLDRVGQDLLNRANEGADAIVAFRNGDQGALQTGLQLAGKMGAAPILDIGGEAIKSGYQSLPQSIQNLGSKAANYVSDSAVGDVARQYAAKYQDFAKNNPNAARSIESGLDLAGVVPIGKAAQAVAEPVQAGVNDIAKGAAGLADQYATKYPGATPFDKITPPAQITPEALEAGATLRYNNATQMGGLIKPEGFADTVNSIKQKVGYQTPEGKIFAGESPVTDAMNRLDAVVKSGNPVSLTGLDEFDGRLRSDISKAYRAGDNESASKLLEIKNMLKNSSETVKPENLVNPDAFNEWRQGDALWTAKSKMQQLQSIVDNAYNTDNPDTAMRTGYKNLYKQLQKNPQGWTPEEMDLINQGAKRGIAAGALKAVSGRLMSHLTALALGGGGAAVGGIPGMVAGFAAGEAAGFPLRAASNALQESRAMAPLRAVGNRASVTKALPQDIKDIMQMPPAQARKALNALRAEQLKAGRSIPRNNVPPPPAMEEPKPPIAPNVPDKGIAEYHAQLDGLVSELNNSYNGGKFFNYDVMGQGGTPDITSWESGNPDWFKNSGFTKSEVERAVKAIKSNKRLGARQQQIKGILDSTIQDNYEKSIDPRYTDDIPF